MQRRGVERDSFTLEVVYVDLSGYLSPLCVFFDSLFSPLIFLSFSFPFLVMTRLVVELLLLLLAALRFDRRWRRDTSDIQVSIWMR